MRAARRMRVVETRCPAFENEFKHTEARVTEVSGSVNFSDKFHEVHFGWRTRLYVCTLEARIVLQRGSRSYETVQMGITISIRCIRTSRSIEITSTFHTQIRNLVRAVVYASLKCINRRIPYNIIN